MTLPINTERRVANYRKQTRRKDLTPRQRRRLEKKESVIRHRRPARP
jgi:hypothetical protein